MENKQKQQKTSYLTRNDVYILVLGLVQSLLFWKFSGLAQQIFYMVSTKQKGMYVFLLFAIIVALSIFSNLSNLVLAYSEKDLELQEKLISKTGKVSVTVLILLLLLTFGTQIRF